MDYTERYVYAISAHNILCEHARNTLGEHARAGATYKYYSFMHASVCVRACVRA